MCCSVLLFWDDYECDVHCLAGMGVLVGKWGGALSSEHNWLLLSACFILKEFPGTMCVLVQAAKRTPLGFMSSFRWDGLWPLRALGQEDFTLLPGFYRQPARRGQFSTNLPVFFPLLSFSSSTSGAATVLNQLESLVTLHSSVIVKSHNTLQVECGVFVWVVCEFLTKISLVVVERRYSFAIWLMSGADSDAMVQVKSVQGVSFSTL